MAKLTHKLEYNRWLDRWRCSVCGYVLGSGREALYAQCPADPDGHIEFDIRSTDEKKTTPKKANIPATPKRQAGRRVARVYRKGSDLFGS